jgi:UDP-glucose 4-epimerase
MTKILVTGGAGFIGSATIAELQKHGHDIYVIDDLSFGKRDFLPSPDMYFHQLDILNGHGLSEVIHKYRSRWDYSSGCHTLYSLLQSTSFQVE